MQSRPAELNQFLGSLHTAIKAQAADNQAVQSVTDRIMNALQMSGQCSDKDASLLPICSLIDNACACVHSHIDSVGTASVDPSVGAHAAALQALAASLQWWRRPDADAVGEPFASGHANAMVVGPKGLEKRSDVWIGISLVAANVNYPVHHHKPEEVYLVLSEGEWQQNNGAWQEPGIGGVVHNPPDIAHAMRSSSKPLLATWCLWVG
jgi:hypothetical protein